MHGNLLRERTLPNGDTILSNREERQITDTPILTKRSEHPLWQDTKYEEMHQEKINIGTSKLINSHHISRPVQAILEP